MDSLIKRGFCIACLCNALLVADSLPTDSKMFPLGQPKTVAVNNDPNTESKNRIVQPAELPVIQESLGRTIAQKQPAQYIRVIIYLRYNPHKSIMNEVQKSYRQRKFEIKNQIRNMHRKYKTPPLGDTSLNAMGFADTIPVFSEEDKVTLYNLNQENESLTFESNRRFSQVLMELIAEDQDEIITTIIRLGGYVEVSLAAQNIIIAKVPVHAIHPIAAMDKVARITQDDQMSAHLQTADNAVRISTPDSLWDNGYTGGIYDVAVLDTGTRRNHPALADITGRRTNYHSYYLVSAWEDELYDDETEKPNTDIHGHGTHIMGIIASMGSVDFENHLGMAYDARKVVTLKAGYRKTDGTTTMNVTDAMALVDRALNHTDEFMPITIPFQDSIEGLNLSFGGGELNDDNDYCRFWDSVVDNYNLFVTISAGNNGPDNLNISSPGLAHNVITVGNIDDRNTNSRDDDVISDSSSHGPTVGGRRKPDVVAPGTNIESCNNMWSTEDDFVELSGTSMAAPMVQGIALCLMETGVTDARELKALLINTARKNHAGIDFEDDPDGWSPVYGFGYVHAKNAYLHNDDVDIYGLTERGTPGSVLYFKGVMQDEGDTGNGRGRATVVWNRHAEYIASDYPTSYWSISDINITLFRESDNFEYDTDDQIVNNVLQVRIDSGEPPTEVVLRVFTRDDDFPFGGDTEQFALATEDGFEKVDTPYDFSAEAFYPRTILPGREFDITFKVTNNGQLISHNNAFELTLPDGWTLIAGDNPVDLGQIISGGGQSPLARWTVRSPDTIQNNADLKVLLSHFSYAQPPTPLAWTLQIDVVPDTFPPTPNPMTFSSLPAAESTSSITMRASVASDDTQGGNNPVYYYFKFAGSPTGGTGGNDSPVLSQRQYTDTQLQQNHLYGYRVIALDAVGNATVNSALAQAYTLMAPPATLTFESVTPDSISVKASQTPPNLTEGDSGLYFVNVTKSINSGWRNHNNPWTVKNLPPDTEFTFKARARNGDGIFTAFSPGHSRFTLAWTPAHVIPVARTFRTVSFTFGPDDNPDTTLYAVHVKDVKTGNNTYINDSGDAVGLEPYWNLKSKWPDPIVMKKLIPGRLFEISVKAKNGQNVETDLSPVQTIATLACPGDFSNNRKVGIADLKILAEFWLKSCKYNDSCNGADMNDNGVVDLQDFTMFSRYFGFNCND